MPKDYDFDSDRPEVILAKAQATKLEAEAKAAIYEARAKLHPFSQAILSFFEGMKGLVGALGCVIFFILIAAGVVLIFAGPVIIQLVRR